MGNQRMDSLETPAIIVHRKQIEDTQKEDLPSPPQKSKKMSHMEPQLNLLIMEHYSENNRNCLDSFSTYLSVF